MKLAVFAIALLLVSCSDNAPATPSNTSPTESKFAHPEKDAEAALAKRDFSLLGVNRFTVLIPGVDAPYENLRKKFKIKVIEGTSDIIIKNDVNGYDAQAEKYAEKYNKRMLDGLGCDPHHPNEKCSNYP